MFSLETAGLRDSALAVVVFFCFLVATTRSPSSKGSGVTCRAGSPSSNDGAEVRDANKARLSRVCSLLGGSVAGAMSGGLNLLLRRQRGPGASRVTGPLKEIY